MDKNPGHNALSAFGLIKRQRDAEKEVEEKKELVSKPDPRLADSAKYGGLNRVLSERLAESRQGKKVVAGDLSTGALIKTILE